MKILLGTWLLLFLRINLNSGHYIRSAGEDDSAVYEVKDGSGVTFVNPKAAQPTLREILYYHIIERPYEKKTPSHQEKAERSFTNSHGYQFLDYEGEPSSDESTQLLSDLIKEWDEQNDDNDEDHQENEVDLGLPEEEEEEAETTTEQNRLTDEEVKEAYKTRSYLFDQARQRYLPKRMVPVDAIVRRKRQAEFEAVPEPPRLSGDAEKDAYIQPKTYGMNLKSDGGYVWNNLNNPATYYEVGQSPNGDQSAGQNQPQSQEPMQPPAEIYNPPAPAPENSNSDSSEDIYVNTDRLPAVLSSDNEGSNEKAPTDISEESEASKESLSEESAEVPIPPIVIENQESNESEAKYPTDNLNEKAPEAQEESAPVAENPEQVNTAENPGSNESPGSEGIPQYEQPASEVDNASGDSNNSEGEKIREIPEAPTLPPLNYDNLPDYIRQAISSTEKTESYEQTDNPYVNPQLKPEDKKEIEDKMEGIFATVQPVEDIPKTYGMNLTSDGGHVWNDLVNPPVSYDVGSTASNQEQEATQAPAISEQPEIQNPSVEPSSPEENKDSEEANVAEQPENPKPSPEEVIPNDNNAQIEQPAEPIEPNEPSEPIEPIAPEQPMEPKGPENEPEPPAEPVHLEPTEPIIPAEPVPLEPTEPIIPAEPVPLEPTEPIIPAEPVPLEPTEPIIPAEPVPLEPMEPVIPAEPEKPVEPVTPEEPKYPEANVPEPGSDESGDIPKPNESETSEESDLPEEEEQDLAHPKPEDDDNKPDIMSELLKSEQFWKWLGEWTATYMELLEKHIRKIAIQEICNRERLGSQICPLDDQPEDSGPIIKDGKLFIDGREISLTHSDNLGSLKRGHKEDKGYKVDATTIYGNSVGNEKVTNVFIFNPDNAKEILEELKPENDSKVEFIIDDRIKEELKEPEKEDKEGKVTEAEKDEEKEPKSDEIVSEKESGDDKKEVVEDVKEINEPNKAISSELNKENEDNQGKPVEA